MIQFDPARKAVNPHYIGHVNVPLSWQKPRFNGWVMLSEPVLWLAWWCEDAAAWLGSLGGRLRVRAHRANEN